MTKRWLSVVGVVASLLIVGLLAASPVLHEYFDSAEGAPSDPREHLTDGVPSRDPSTAAPALAAGPQTADPGPHASPDPGRYRLDADTSRPERVGYSDPFTPAIPPFKRLFAYDAVNERLELVVRESSLAALPIGGKARGQDDQFLGEIDVASAPGRPVRIPSVGPAARVLGARTVPAATYSLWSDSAENWFIESQSEAPMRLIVHLAIDRATFGSPFAQTSWERLEAHLPPRPAFSRRVALPVLRELELSQAVLPSVALSRLVAHFRSFAPSDEQFAEQGEQLYQKIALGKLGVCRHRSFAFVITALALGLPSRFVHNEAHAWVEVYDGKLWHRIDLGGAASDLLLGGALDVPHVAPPDPLPWPANSETATDMVEGAVGRSPAGSSGAAETDPAAPSVTPTAAATSAVAPSAAAPDSTASPDLAASAEPASSSDPAATGAPEEGSAQPEPSSKHAHLLPAEVDVDPDVDVAFIAHGEQVVRGDRVLLRGRVRSKSNDCALVRVNVLLRDAQSRPTPIGVLVTDAAGNFEGEIAVPPQIPVGDYEVVLATPAGTSCGPASSEVR